MSGPLAGVRVLDLSTVLSGPVATAVLADQGADVIKVEAPGGRDVARVVGSMRGGQTALYHLVNRGKRGIVLDLGTATGLQLLLRLVRTADVVVQNFRPGVAERMGIGEDALRAERPDLIYVSISGFGERGPLAGHRVYDNLIQAVSGTARLQGGDDAEPAYVKHLVCDKVTALTAAQAITAALFARDRGAGGQHLRLSMLDANVSFLWYDGATPYALLEDDAVPVPTGRSYGMVRHADGWTTSSPVSDDEFRGWCRALGAPEVADDPRFATHRARLSHPDFDEARREVMARGASLTVQEALARFAAEGVDAVAVRSLPELADDPQTAANGTFFVRDHPVLGRIRETHPPVRFSATPAAAGAPAPSPGEHTDEVLAELGCAGDDIARWRAEGVFG